MGVSVLLLLLGAAVLTVGAEAAIRGAGRFADERGISSFALGAVLFGIDLESLGAALVAAGRGQTSLAAGQAFGTVIFLFAAGFGVALLLARHPVKAPSRDMILLPGAALAAGAAALSDQAIGRAEGFVLVGLYIFYLSMVVRDGRGVLERGEAVVRESQEGPRLPPVFLLVLGLAMVYGGATALVEGGIRLLGHTSLAAGFVGAAVVGGLASLDEVLLEVLPVRRGMHELATGNLFGTMAAFSTGVLGLAALIRPLEVDSAAGSAVLASAALYAVVGVAFLARGSAGKLVGLVLIGAYGAWLAFASQI